VPGRITRGWPAPLAALASQNPALSVTAPAVVPGLIIELEVAGAMPGAGFGIREIVIRPA
jgi:3-polyprenyl-4-hydroxybenzoate decarboxylase